MSRRSCSGSGWLLFLATLRTVLTHAHDGGLGELSTAKIMVDRVWTSADTITVSILPFNLSNHNIFVSVTPENDTTMSILDTLTEQTIAAQGFLTPIQHHVDGLEPETKYELCVALSSLKGPHPGIVQNECYKVKTFPRVDNVKGVYGALVAVGVFLVACGLGWLLYKTIWVKYFTKSLKVHDSEQQEHPMTSRPDPSPIQEIISSETESTLSSVVKTQ